MNKIYIVGMGPGFESMMTKQAIDALEESDVIVGYTVYIKLLGEKFCCTNCWVCCEFRNWIFSLSFYR